MRTLTDTSWAARGLSLMWGGEALGRQIPAHEAVSLRQLFQMAKAWPDDLPSRTGNAVLAVGLESCLDCLAPEEAERWLEERVRPMLLSFQSHYEGQAALLLWLPGGRRRVLSRPASERYLWSCHPAEKTLPLGQLLWSGAETEVRRIVDPTVANQDSDGPAWIGLHHPRVS